MRPAAAGQLQDADVTEVAVTLREIQAIAHHEFVGNLETDVVRPHLLDARRGLTQKRGHAQRARSALQKHALKISKSPAGIQDVFNENRVEALDAVVQILGQSNLAGTVGGLPIAGHRDEIQGYFEINLPDQIGEENRCALEDTDEVQALAAEIGGDSAAQLADSPLDGITAKENAQLFRLARSLQEALLKKVGTV